MSDEFKCSVRVDNKFSGVNDFYIDIKNGNKLVDFFNGLDEKVKALKGKDMKVKTVADAVESGIQNHPNHGDFEAVMFCKANHNQAGTKEGVYYKTADTNGAYINPHFYDYICTRQEFEDYVKQQDNKHDKNNAAIATLESLGYEHNGGELWKPLLKVKPVYTQEMADNGELPPVGSDCMIKRVHEDDSHFNKGYIIGLSKCNEWLVFSDSLDNLGQNNIKNGVYRFKPIDTRTDKEKLIDKAKELCKNLDEEDFDNLFNVYLK